MEKGIKKRKRIIRRTISGQKIRGMKKFVTLKEARKYAKAWGGQRIIFTTEEENYLVV